MPRYVGGVSEDIWASLADQSADKAYASVKGLVRTYVMHQQLLEQLPPPPARVLDVGGGAKPGGAGGGGGRQWVYAG